MKYYYIIITFFSFHCAIAQIIHEETKNNHEFDIQRIDINNPIIIDVVRAFIQQKKTKIKEFKEGYGFVALNMLNYTTNHKPVNVRDPDLYTFYKDTVISFTLELRSHPLLLDDNPKIYSSTNYSPYYTFIDNTLILLYDNVISIFNGNSFSKKTMKKLSKIVSFQLKKAFEDDFVFKHPFENIEYTLTKKERKHLTKNDIYIRSCMNLIDSQIVYILRNGNVLIKEN